MRIMRQGEPITDGAPLIYTDRAEGVLPEYDPRTDRFEIAIETMEKAAKTHVAKREERMNPKAAEPGPDAGSGGDGGGGE